MFVMAHTKNYILVLFLFLLLNSICSCDTLFPEPDEPELPPITTTSENIFGAIINEEVRETSSKFFITALHPRDSILQLSSELDGISSDRKILISLQISGIKIEEGEYQSTNFPNTNYFIFKYNEDVEECDLDPFSDSDGIFNGTLHITHLDPTKQILSGTFE